MIKQISYLFTLDFFKILKKQLKDGNITVGSAALSYYLLLATFPALITIIAFLPYIPIEGLETFLSDLIYNNFPAGTGQTINNLLKEVLKDKQPALISTSFIGTIWASTSGTVAIMKQLNIAYRVEKSSNFAKMRIKALLLGSSFLVLTLTLGTLNIYLSVFDEYLKFFSENFPIIYDIVKYFIYYLILIFFVSILYYIGPKGKRKFKYITPGSVISSLFIIISTLGFDYYISNFGNYNKTYGSIGGIIVYMVWLYIVGFVVLLGAHINNTNKKIDKKE